MALTRKLLKSLGLEEAAIDTIIDAHTESTDALKQQRDNAIAQAESAAAITTERDQLKQQLEQLKSQSGDAAKVQAEYDAYKQQVETDRVNASKGAAVRKALKAAGVQRDEFVDLLMGKVDLASVEMDGESVKDAATVIDPLRASYAGCFAATGATGVPPVVPPTKSPTAYTREQLSAMSPEEINRNWDSVKQSLAAPK